MATCEDIRPLLGAYADAQLDALETDAVVVHLEQCGRCRQTVRDQQQVQHVLDSWAPPPVEASQWAEMGRRLRGELEGRGEPLVLKTRPRTESLESTPASTPALSDDEVPQVAHPGPESVQPKSRRWWSKAAPAAPAPKGPAPATSILRVPARRSKSRTMWLAHAAGVAAAVVAIAVAVTSQQAPPARLAVAPVISPFPLAQSQDVAIMDVQTMDPDYNVIIDAGNASGAATISVVLNRNEG